MSEGSYLYIFGLREQSPYKIGYSHSPAHRAMAFPNAYKDIYVKGMKMLETVYFKNREAAASAESHVHSILHEWRINDEHRGEWFDVSLEQAQSALADASVRFLGKEATVSKKATTIILQVNDEMLARIDDLRRLDQRLPGRTEVIKRAINLAYDLGYPSMLAAD